MSLFLSTEKPGITSNQQHSLWLQMIRERIWSKIKYEEEMIPSEDALNRHWRRSCWVMTVWGKCTHNIINYPDLNGSGWKVSNGELAIDWDSEENQAKVRVMVSLIRKGCGCKTGCNSSRCKCKRQEKFCYGCKCIECRNVRNLPNAPAQVDESDEESEVESVDLETDVYAMMVEIFGSNYDTSDSECSVMDDQ